MEASESGSNDGEDNLVAGSGPGRAIVAVARTQTKARNKMGVIVYTFKTREVQMTGVQVSKLIDTSAGVADV